MMERNSLDPLNQLDQTMNRRAAIKHLGACAMTAPLVLRAGAGEAQAARQPVVVDTHFHLWAADETRFPFHPDAPYRPDHRSTLEQWLQDRSGSGIDYGVSVHPEPYQDDHRYVLHCLERAPDRLRGTCLFDPEAPDSPDRMQRLVRGRPFVAARIHSPDSAGRSPDWSSRTFEAYWERIGELGLVAMVHLRPEWSWQLEGMLERYPASRVHIDHLGRPRQGSPIDYEVLLGLSRFPNVCMKISSLGGQSEQDPPYENLKPLAREIVRRFTPQRVMWGASYRGGIGTSGYAAMLSYAQQLLDFLPADDRAMVLGETARREYGFP
jgi:predicted TIM-barrel fold metal-dependent hydrolase